MVWLSASNPMLVLPVLFLGRDHPGKLQHAQKSAAAHCMLQRRNKQHSAAAGAGRDGAGALMPQALS